MVSLSHRKNSEEEGQQKQLIAGVNFLAQDKTGRRPIFTCNKMSSDQPDKAPDGDAPKVNVACSILIVYCVCLFFKVHVTHCWHACTPQSLMPPANMCALQILQPLNIDSSNTPCHSVAAAQTSTKHRSRDGESSTCPTSKPWVPPCRRLGRTWRRKCKPIQLRIRSKRS